MTNTLELGGAETSLIRLTGGLRSRGHKVAVLSGGGALLADLERAGGLHYRAPVRLGLRDLVRSAIALRLLVQRFRPDVIHAMSPAGNLATQLIRRGKRPAIVSSPMGLQASDREPAWLTLARNAMLVLRAERVLVISEEIGRSLAPFRLSPRRIIHCNVNGIDVASFATPGAAELEALRSELGVGGAHVVATIGALHPRKSHELFIRAAAIVHRTHPSVRFLITGEGPERPALTRLIQREGLGGVVILTGSRRDVPRVLALADVYVKPGVVEGFVGLTVLEAMAMRVPVVAFDTLDVRAAIDPGLTGLLVPRGDVAALAAEVGRLLDQPGAARALTERAHAHVGEHFSLDAVVADVERAYNEVLTGR